MRPSPPILQFCDPNVSFPDSPRGQDVSKEYTWQDKIDVQIDVQIDVVSTGLHGRNGVIFDHCSKRDTWSVKWDSEPPFMWCLPIRQEILNECFADSNNIPWNPPTIFHPDLIATILQMSLPSFCALLSQESQSFPVCAVLTYNDSRLILHSVMTFWFPCRLQELL